MARSITDLLQTLRRLELNRVEVKILNLRLDTSTPTGKQILTVLGGIAQFEREMMLERQREGISKAKKAGKYKGRKPIHEEKRAAILYLALDGVPKTKTAQQVGVGQATVYRELAASRLSGTGTFPGGNTCPTRGSCESFKGSIELKLKASTKAAH